MKKKTLERLIIRRKDWYRGKGGDRSVLLSGRGKMCCLGFLGLACGYTKKEILGVQTPACASRRIDAKAKWPSLLLNKEGGDSIFGDDLMRMNDNREIKDSVREAELKELFKEINYEVVFK